MTQVEWPGWDAGVCLCAHCTFSKMGIAFVSEEKSISQGRPLAEQAKRDAHMCGPTCDEPICSELDVSLCYYGRPGCTCATVNCARTYYIFCSRLREKKRLRDPAGCLEEGAKKEEKKN